MSRQAGGVAFNPVTTHAPPPNLQTFETSFGVKGGQRRREKNSKAEKFTESTENPFKVKPDTIKNPNDSKKLVYLLPLVQSTGVSQWQLKRHLKAEDWLYCQLYSFTAAKRYAYDSDEFYKTHIDMDLNEPPTRTGQRRHKKMSKAEKLIYQQQKLVPCKESTEESKAEKIHGNENRRYKQKRADLICTGL